MRAMYKLFCPKFFLIYFEIC